MDDKEARVAETVDTASGTQGEAEGSQEEAVEILEGDVTLDDEAVDPDMGLSDEEEFAYKIVERATKLKGVRVDRDVFLRTELAKHCPASVVDAAVATTTQQAGVSMEVMDKVADAAISLETKKVSGLSALAGIPGGLAMVGTVPADLVNYFAHVLRIEQKLAYAYGWPSFLGDDDEIDDETMYRLILFLGIIMQVGGINSSLTSFATHTAMAGIAKTIEKQALTKTFWYPVLKKVMAALGVKVTKSSFANAVAKGVPIVGGVVSGGITWVTYKQGATSLKNHLRLLPQATGGVAEEADLKAMLDAEDERQRKEREERIAEARDSAAALAGSAAEGAAALAGSAAQGASKLAGAIGGGLSGFASRFSKAKGAAPAESAPQEPPAPAADSAKPSLADVASELRTLKELLDDGIISQEDFEAKKAQLLGI